MWLSSRLKPLRSGSHETILDFVPQTLTIVEVIQVIVIFVTRQVLGLFGKGNSFDVISSGIAQDEHKVPKLRLSMPFSISPPDLIEYAKAVGCSEQDFDKLFDDPTDLCLMLSAFSEPAFLLLLAHHKSPVRPLGAVNVGNRFELLRSDLCTAEAILRLQSKFEARARLIPETRRVKRGLEIDLKVELVQLESEVVVFRQVFTTLQFMKFESKSAGLPKYEVVDVFESEWMNNDGGVSLSINADRIMHWTHICKDYNPIHLSTLAAQAFGFPGRLLHGNHAFAAGLRALRAAEKDDVVVRQRHNTTCEMEVQFRRPIVVDSTLIMQSMKKDRQIELFRIMKGGKVFTKGRLTGIDKG